MNTEVCANEDINVKIYDTDQLKQVNMMTFLAGLFQPLFWVSVTLDDNEE